MIAVKDNKSLNEAIAFLENQQKSDLYLLKEHFEFTKEQLNPIHIIKENFREAVSSPSIKGKLLKGALGVASGFLAKKFFLGGSNNPLAKIAGKAVQAGVSGLVMKAPGMNHIKDDGISMLQKGLDKLKIK